MNIFREIPPTAGIPLYAKDFLSLFKINYRGEHLEEDFRNYLNVPYAAVTYSGTAALYLILEGLKDLSHKKTVIITSYICPLVPLAVKRAGLKVEVCDINRDDFNFNMRELEDICSKNNDVLAILVTHLAGIPADFYGIKMVAEKNNIFIIENCAQSLGAMYKGKKVGTLGDVSFFSLTRGKGLTIYMGGVITTNKQEYAAKIESVMKRLAGSSFLSESLKMLELFGYWIFYRPRLFWFVYRLPEIFWSLQGQKIKAEKEYFSINFPIHRVSGIRKLLGHVKFASLENHINKQRGNAAYYIEGLENAIGVKVIKETVGNRATYPYVTLIFDDPEKRRKALEVFRNSGLGISEMYSFQITGYDYIKDIVGNKNFPNARFLAERVVTLSTGIFLRKRDKDAILITIKNLFLS